MLLKLCCLDIRHIWRKPLDNKIINENLRKEKEWGVMKVGCYGVLC